MADTNEVVTINAKQVDKLLEFGFKPEKATLNFVSDDEDYFHVVITLSNGTSALFLGERGRPRQYKNPVFFIQWAKRRGIETIEFEPINMKDVALRDNSED